MMTMKLYLLALILVVVMVEVSAQGDTKCKFEHRLYNVGQIIRFLPEVCRQTKCMTNNVIVTETPFGTKAKDCCLCHNKLYIGKSKTCTDKKKTGKCPAECNKGGKMFPHGALLDSNLAKCLNIRCLDGKATDEHPVGKEKTGCCQATKTMIAHGTETTIGGECIPQTCIKGGWVPSPTKIVKTCKKCHIFNDPHFVDFSGAIFDWHLGCNHALLQEGTKADPAFGVFMDFNRRGSIGYIAGPTTYQEDKNTKVVLNPGKFEVTVNGHQQVITSTSPSFLVGPGGIKTTALAWKYGSCIKLYGEPKILVQLCGSQITIWTTPWDLRAGLQGIKKQAGLCGRTEERFLQKKTLVDRIGNEYPNPGTYRSANANFGNSWKAPAAQQSKPACGAVGGRKKRDAQEDQAEKLREECQTVKTKESPYLTQCLPVIEDAGLIGADRANLLNACVFDLCIAATDPEAPVTVDGMLNQHKEIAAETKDQEDNTVDVPAETKCPAEWSLVGDQCYRTHLFTEDLSFGNAQEHCLSEKASLAQPRDLKATKNFLRDTIVALKDDGEAKCPNGWSLVGDQCYQAHPFSEGLSFDDAHKHCLSQNGSLAQPRDPHATKNFLRSTLQGLSRKEQGHGWYWVGGRRKGGAMQWLIGGGVIPNDQFLMGRPRNSPYSCLEMRPRLDDNFAPLATDHCNEPEGYLCEIGLILGNGHHAGGTTQWLIGGGGRDPYNCLDLQPLIGDKNPPLTKGKCIKPEGYICEKDTLECGDEDDECVWRAADGDCDGNRDYMYNSCKASCKVSCDCDQPDTCTEIGGKCQPQGDKCDAVSDPTLCSGDSCTCCYVPDPCKDAEDQDCESYVEQGFCESDDDYVLEELNKICSLSCGFCEPY